MSCFSGDIKIAYFMADFFSQLAATNVIKQSLYGLGQNMIHRMFCRYVL